MATAQPVAQKSTTPAPPTKGNSQEVGQGFNTAMTEQRTKNNGTGTNTTAGNSNSGASTPPKTSNNGNSSAPKPATASGASGSSASNASAKSANGSGSSGKASSAGGSQQQAANGNGANGNSASVSADGAAKGTGSSQAGTGSTSASAKSSANSSASGTAASTTASSNTSAKAPGSASSSSNASTAGQQQAASSNGAKSNGSSASANGAAKGTGSSQAGNGSQSASAKSSANSAASNTASSNTSAKAPGSASSSSNASTAGQQQANLFDRKTISNQTASGGSPPPMAANPNNGSSPSSSKTGGVLDTTSPTVGLPPGYKLISDPNYFANNYFANNPLSKPGKFYLTTTQNIPKNVNLKGSSIYGSPELTQQTENGNDKNLPLFKVSNGATLSNFSIDGNGSDGVKIVGSGNIDNGKFNSIGDEAITIDGTDSDDTAGKNPSIVNITNSTFGKHDDKYIAIHPNAQNSTVNLTNINVSSNNPKHGVFIRVGGLFGKPETGGVNGNDDKKKWQNQARKTMKATINFSGTNNFSGMNAVVGYTDNSRAPKTIQAAGWDQRPNITITGTSSNRLLGVSAEHGSQDEW